MKRYHAFWGVLALLLAAGALGLRADDQPANVAGAWQMSVDGGQGTLTMVLTIQQDGGTIKGTSKSDFGESPLEGTVKGNAIDFTVHVKSDNGDFDVEHTGTVDGDTMKGTFKMQGNADFSGQWSATRQK
ncbi:MAG TPA: hypothetical protein VEH50_02575 [Methylomirabilota bacterium]|jgi:hypothetical protein|nr:hypothetical protein [Methylomirabilota bacterium]